MRGIAALLLTFIGILGVFLFPWWGQLLLIAGILFFVRPAALALIPAFLADLSYSPGIVSVVSFHMTLLALLGLISYWILQTKTRFFHVYDFLEK